MSGLFGILNIGRSSLLAQQLGVRIVGHNIANANTEGYTRRRLSLIAADPVQVRGHTVGAGVRAGAVVADRDRLIEEELIRNRYDLARDQARSSLLDGVQTVIAPPGEAGIGPAFNAFFAAWQDLAADPGSTTARSQVLSRGEALARRMQTQYADLDRREQAANRELASIAAEVNSLAGQVAALNPVVQQRELAFGDAGDLRDQRDQLLRELADRIDIVTYEGSDSMVEVYVGGGRPLVVNDQAGTLEVQPDPALPGAVRLHFSINGGVSHDITDRVQGGRTSGLILAAADIRTFQGRLDQLAHDLITQVNAGHVTGYGLDGNDGRNFFADPPDPVDPAGAARTMALDPLLKDQPDRVAAATDPLALPGDNRSALAVTDLEQGFTDDLGLLVSEVGLLARDVESDREFHEGALQQTEAFREAISGVSLDEEMIDMIQYQQAFNAAARVIQTADELLETVLSLKR